MAVVNLVCTSTRTNAYEEWRSLIMSASFRLMIIVPLTELRTQNTVISIVQWLCSSYYVLILCIIIARADSDSLLSLLYIMLGMTSL